MKSGNMMCKRSFGSNWRQRFLKLNGTTLSIWNDELMSNLKERIKINESVRLSLKSSTSICLVLPDSTTLHLSAESLDEIVEWYNAFKTAKDDLYEINIDSFDFIKKVGIGHYGEVSLVKMYETNELVAVKISKNRKTAENESNLMKKLENQFIIQFRFFFEFNHKSYLGIEYCNGGDLLDRLDYPLSFNDAKLYAAEIIDALSYLHSHGIIFRDMKPENVLLTQSGHIKLADFGLSKILLSDDEKVKSYAGTQEYSAPEVITGKLYGKESDIWSLGVVTYTLFFGSIPFFSKTHAKLLKNITEKEIDFPENADPNVTEFIKATLQKEPSKRPMINQLKEYKLFEGIDWVKLENFEYSFESLPVLKDHK
ncbi:RAC family serine/threonine-protein kinase like protein [Tritrichomonas foetus]|uniref:RAC family serine/threonine-protein kinase like protein n=1 Tax=Tritrichomonas foetus TaxID=1144522 RepID=A0A1J4KXF1_9EUKA|nr:RAC family serine/threonine-protein kinase like protein [Tritrichomonas foetus]|eukprot:OHT14380.1 RAC family serine/threonine-protein kinase like protein [Tritrichomonas foetus]